MDKYGPPRDGNRGGGRDRRDSNGGYQDGNHHSWDEEPSGGGRRHWGRGGSYHDLDDPNQPPTAPSSLPPPLFASADLPNNPNRYDSDQRDPRPRRKSYHHHDSGDGGRPDGDEDYRNEDRPRWKGKGKGRDDNFNGDRPHGQSSRHRDDYGERQRDQGWKPRSSSNNYHNGGGGGRGGRGGQERQVPLADWRNVGNGNAGAPAQDAWATASTPAPVADWGGDSWGASGSAGDSWGAGGSAGASAWVADNWGGDGWGPSTSTEGNDTTMDTSGAVETSTAQANAPPNDPPASQVAQSWPAPPAPSYNSPPAQSDPWASGWSTQQPSASTPTAQNAPQPSAGTESDPWKVQGQSPVPDVSTTLQGSSNWGNSDRWGGFHPSPPEPTSGIPAPSAHAPGPAQSSMELDSWPHPTPISPVVNSRSPSVDLSRSSNHSKPAQFSRSPHYSTPESPPRPSPTSRSQNKAPSDPRQAKRNKLFTKILPHCRRAVEKDTSVPEQQKAVEVSSLAVRLAVERANLLGGLEEPALTLEIEKLIAGEKNKPDVPPPPVQRSAPIPAVPIPPPRQRPIITFATPERTLGPSSLILNRSNTANSTAPTIADATLQPDAMQVDAESASVLARWTCINKCSTATFAFSFNQSTPLGNPVVVLICRSPAGGGLDLNNEDGTWQVFTTIINRGTEREEVHLLPPLPQSSYRIEQDLSLDITENVVRGQNTVELKRMMLLGGLAGFTFEVKLVSP